MKIVIDIPIKTYEHIRSWGGHGIFNIQDDDNLIVTKAIFNSAPYEERPTGHWIEEPSKLPHCSVCGTYSDDADGEDGGFYCTHCGSRMIGDIYENGN